MNSDLQIEFTVFTAVYNGASTIDRVYRSLLGQTRTAFEWLIIDDGSTDQIADVIRSKIDENKVSIRFYRQSNMHKFFTLQQGISLARGIFFLIADADDEFAPDTLERLSTTFKAMPSDTQKTLVGVNCLCKNSRGEIIGDPYPKHLMVSDHCEMHYRYRVKGEKWGMQRTEILRKFRFTEDYFNNGYIPENLLWSSIANAGHKIVFINEPLRTYHNEGDRKSISTTARDNRKANSFGSMQDLKGELNSQLKYFRYDPLHFFKITILYIEASRYQGVTISQQVQNLLGLARLLYWVLLPISIPMLWWRRQL